jgi:3-hydroxyisobutyrate dehydrogenase-like beta-hydroxyacid dehydrogenase
LRPGPYRPGFKSDAGNIVTRISFIGFGEAGRAWAASLAMHQKPEIRAYDILLETREAASFRAAAAERNVVLAADTERAIEGADFIISAVTASQCLEAAQAAAKSIAPGQTYFDINSVSPERKKQAAAVIYDAGGNYVDMAVMAAVHPKGHRTPVLVAGDLNGQSTAFLDRFEFTYEIVATEPGPATAIKMIRSLFVKGLEALTVQTLSAAQKTGCGERVLASLQGSFPGLSWDKFASYQFERVARHGIRRAAEMRECARTYSELGFPVGDALASAIADLQQAVGGAGIDAGADNAPLEWAEKTRRVLDSEDAK